MLFHFLYPLADNVKLFNLFKYITFRSILAAAIALIIAIIYGKYFIEKRGGRVYSIKKYVPEAHHKKAHIPTGGGLIILAGFISAIAVCGNFDDPLILLSSMGLIGFGMIGYFDDHIKEKYKDGKGIKPKKKLALQIIVSSLLVGYLYLQWKDGHIKIFYPIDTELTFSHIFFPMFKNAFFDLGIFFWGLAILVLISSSNAVNITDGLDGLAVGLYLFVLISFIAFSYLSGHILLSEYLHIPYIQGAGEMTVFLAALCGACLGFFWYNSHPAQVFMGDTGSLALGGVMGLVAIILKIELLLPVIAGIFVLEALSVIIQVGVYKRWKKRVFKMSPLHHHFELIGWHENKIITRFWIVGILFALIGIATLKIR